MSLSLSGYEDLREDVPDEVTTVAVRSDERILAESHSLGFKSKTEPRRAVYEGDGPVNIYMTVGDGGEEYDHYRLFGDGNLTRADELYSLVPSVTGFEAETAGGRHPVVSLPDDVYDEKVNRWSQGQYRTGGLILVRESVASEDGAPVVLHEVTHAYNEEALRWSRPSVSWFDEGTAQYVEFVATNRIGARQPEIFGETVEWEDDCEDGDGDARCVYKLRPRKQPDDLWEYYSSGSDFMVDWSPDNPRNRAFGYAFSELAVRNYVRQNGEGSLSGVYDSLLSTRDRVTDPRKSSRVVLDAMDTGTDTDLRPCYSESYDDFEACLDEVNEMGDIDEGTRTDETVDMGGEGGTPEIQVENATPTDRDASSETQTGDTEADQQTSADGGIENGTPDSPETSSRGFVRRLFDRLLSGIRSLFR